MSKICIIGNKAVSLIKFRGHLIQSLISDGHQVYAIAPDCSLNEYIYLKSFGSIPINFNISRTGRNIFRDISDFIRLFYLLNYLKIDVIIAYTIKPVIYGILAAWIARVQKRYALITGLGYVFIISDKNNSLNKYYLQFITTLLYKISLSKATRIFFQNDDDLNEFITRKIIRRDKALLIGPTGVDLKYFASTAPIKKPITFILIGRLLKEKGVIEYCKAAYLIKQKFPDTRFILLGGYDSNPGALSKKEMQDLLKDGIIEYYGNVSDVRPWLAKSSVFVLPSYREGCPRSIQEAMAMGRPIITTDVPGCRITVIHMKNGFLVPPLNVSALVAAMEKFCIEPHLIEQMGIESRKIAENLFDINKINKKLISQMEL